MKSNYYLISTNIINITNKFPKKPHPTLHSSRFFPSQRLEFPEFPMCHMQNMTQMDVR